MCNLKYGYKDKHLNKGFTRYCLNKIPCKENIGHPTLSLFSYGYLKFYYT